MNRKESVLMFKVGKMYVESVTRFGVSLTINKNNAMKIDFDAECDSINGFAENAYRVYKSICDTGLEVRMIRETVETKVYIDDVKFYAGSFGQIKLAMERSEE